MKFAPFVSLLVLVATTLPGRSAPSGSPEKPNIIFILGDDVGIGDIACTGADRYKTPNIDALAKAGMVFRRAYAEPLCGPSRACIMTGRYVFRTGATNQDATGEFRPKDEIMMPPVLKAAGYATSCIGKWGQLPLGPADFGFDDYLKFQGSGTYWNTQARGKQYELNGKKVPLRDREYMPDVMHAHLVDFITRHHDQPFYIYYSLSHVHAEILPTPDSKPDSQDLYADNVAYMDKLVGKLMAELDRQHLRERTLVIYFGDNGTATAHADAATIGGRRLLGEKGSMFEGGSRVPMIANWPGVTPAGKVTDALLDSTDFFPTFAELAGAPLPGNRVIDGRSFVRALHGENVAHRDWVFIQLARMWYVADQRYKLNQKGELYDLSDAPFAEKRVPADTTDGNAVAARRRLQAVLEQLNPAGGHIDQGDGTGRHANRAKKRAQRQAEE